MILKKILKKIVGEKNNLLLNFFYSNINGLFQQYFKLFEPYVSCGILIGNSSCISLLVTFEDILNKKNDNQFIKRCNKILYDVDKKLEKSATLSKLEKIDTFWKKAPDIIHAYKTEFNDINEKNKKDFFELIRDIKNLIFNPLDSEQKKQIITNLMKRN